MFCPPSGPWWGTRTLLWPDVLERSQELWVWSRPCVWFIMLVRASDDSAHLGAAAHKCSCLPGRAVKGLKSSISGLSSPSPGFLQNYSLLECSLNYIFKSMWIGHVIQHSYEDKEWEHPGNSVFWLMMTF